MRIQVHNLELVYPPISNQEAEWLKEDEEVQKAISNSNLYFIGQRAEAFFLFGEDVQQKILDEHKIYFEYTSGGLLDNGYIDLVELLKLRNRPEDSTFEIELGRKLIRIWLKTNTGNEMLDWLTTEKIVVDKSRDFPHIIGFLNYKEFLKYHLHYVGISKKENSLQRLIIKPHDKRLRILSNEYPFSATSRITDEMVIFFFRISSLELKQYLEDNDFDEVGFTELHNYERIVADAEKAFVNIMNTNYNEIKFKEYPYSIDGLYSTTVDRHTFSINEDFQFITDSVVIKGVRKKKPDYAEGDWIAVSKESVVLMKVDDFINGE